jgi:hypothetical protein
MEYHTLLNNTNYTQSTVASDSKHKLLSTMETQNVMSETQNDIRNEPSSLIETQKEQTPPQGRDVKNGKRFIISLMGFSVITILNWLVPRHQWPWKFFQREMEQPQELSLPAQLVQYYNLRAISAATPRPIMSTFFTPVEGGCCGMSEQGHLNLVKAWEEAWQSWGWDTRVLTEEDAKKHPRFEEMQQKLSLSDVNEYNHRCFWRWLAMANDDNVMAGWMSDYDAFPLLLTGEVGYELMSVEGFKSWALHVPTLIHADRMSWERMLDYMIKVISPDLDVEMITDMFVLNYLHENFPEEELDIKTWEVQTYHGAYIYKHVEGSDKPAVDCEQANLALVSHLSHHDTRNAVINGLYPKLEGMIDRDARAGLERRAEAATVMMNDYRETCFS